MKKYILISLIVVGMLLPFFMFKDKYWPGKRAAVEKEKLIYKIDLKACEEELLKYLKFRKDKLAGEEVEKILSVAPDNLCALWGRAEVMRRAYKFKEAEAQLKQVLSQYPDHAPSLISMAYIKYRNHKFAAALKMLKLVLRQSHLERENRALAYMLIGSVHAKKADLGGFFSKAVYGSRIKGYFEKAKSMAADLAEVRLGLGTFYLLAPKIIGGDIDKAILELEAGINLAPDFATPYVRLAQAYKKKGDLEKYNFYLRKARELNPENEVLNEESGS